MKIFRNHFSAVSDFLERMICMANARRLPSGSWRVQVYAGRDENGKMILQSFTAPTKREAERDAAVWAMERKRKLKSSLTLGEAIDKFIDTCKAQGYSPSTIPDYISRRNHSYPTLINRKIDEITAADVQSAMDERAAERSVKTVRNDYFLLKKVLNKYAPGTDLSGIILAKRQKRRKVSMSESWAEDILTYAHSDPELYIYCALTISAGLRSSESYALTWGDISPKPVTMLSGDTTLKLGYITVNKACVRSSTGYVTKTTKTESGIRTIPVAWSLINSITGVKQRGTDDERILELKPALIDRRWVKLREALNLPDTMRFYDLRHYYATSLAYSGASEE